ncbi:MAG: RluA family pseudouridine synthase [Clostridia bacterium]|nr:RluA family pseudouridine synthase [Clostridia bacterium]
MARTDRLTYLCQPEDAGLEVLTLLRREFRLSANLLRQLKTSETGILLDGVRVTVRQRVTAGQALSILREPDSGKTRRVPPAPGALDIVYEDGDLLILNKPAGLAVHPSPGHRDGDTLGNRVVWHLSQMGQTPTFRAINRLDRGTSGLMTCAKNKLAAQRLEDQLAAGDIRRIYHAVTEGDAMPDEGTVDLPIGKAEGCGIRRCVRDDGQRAVTHFRVLRRQGGRALLELRLETGRTHQIRCHMSHLGFPLCGDFMYGREIPGMTGFALHSCLLSLLHPSTGEALSFAAPDPEIFTRLLGGRL